MQKRAPLKKQCPNKWDIPSAGHVDAGEDLLSACKRETFEELGIELEKDAFIFVKEYFNQRGWEFSQHYLVFNSTKIEEMILDEKEVAEVKWLNIKEFEKLLYSDEFVPHKPDYKEMVLKFIKDAIKKQR